MTEAKIEKSVFLKAPRARVWEFLTAPDRLARWFHPANRPLTETGPYHFWKSLEETAEPYCWGEVLDVEHEVRLVYTFAHKWLGGHETRVEWRLSEVASGTLVQLVHDRFADAPVDVFDALCDHDAGWDEHFAKLRDLAREPAIAE
jgi:uncharacterized protein YndB with AHSA1/START domain